MRRWRQERSLILKRWAEEKRRASWRTSDRRLGKAQAQFRALSLFRGSRTDEKGSAWGPSP